MQSGSISTIVFLLERTNLLVGVHQYEFLNFYFLTVWWYESLNLTNYYKFFTDLFFTYQQNEFQCFPKEVSLFEEKWRLTSLRGARVFTVFKNLRATFFVYTYRNVLTPKINYKITTNACHRDSRLQQNSLKSAKLNHFQKYTRTLDNF